MKLTSFTTKLINFVLTLTSFRTKLVKFTTTPTSDDSKQRGFQKNRNPVRKNGQRTEGLIPTPSGDHNSFILKTIVASRRMFSR